MVALAFWFVTLAFWSGYRWFRGELFADDLLHEALMASSPLGVLAAIGPFWDGNEVWLVVFGGPPGFIVYLLTTLVTVASLFYNVNALVAWWVRAAGSETGASGD